MKRTIFPLLILLSCCFVLRAQSWQDTVARIDQIFEKYKQEHPGCQIAISKNGNLVYAKALGMADLSRRIPLSATTLIEAGSVSKQFTAAAVLLLQQQGKLALDDDVHKYLPELPAYGVQVTIGQMMHHTSGLKDCWALMALSDSPRGSKLYKNADILHLISRQSTLNYKPGDEFLYSNSNYVLLAIIVERLSGKTLAQFTDEHIFRPAGMRHTFWRTTKQEKKGERATAYGMEQGAYAPDMPNEEVYGSGGLLTTAEDLLRWNAFYTKNKLGNPGLLTGQVETTALNNGQANNYAAGIRVVSIRGWKVYIHDGATAAYRSSLEYYPEQGLSIAWLSNTSALDGKADGLNELRSLLLPDKSPVQTVSPQTLAPERKEGAVVQNKTGGILLKSYTGRYHSDEVDANLDIKLENGDLIIERKGNQRYTLRSDRADGFKIKDSNVSVKFVRDQSARLSGLSFTTPRVRNVVFRFVGPAAGID